MTRDYNKQRRDDVRPSSRNQFTNRQRDEQSPRPARPRLNRETVDRAWEAGASTQHADYRPRRSNTFNGQAPRDNRRYNQSSEQSSAPNGRKPFGNRTDSNRRFERTTPDNNSSFRSRSFNSDRGTLDEQRHHEYRQRPEDRYNSGNRPGSRDSAQPPAYERRSSYRDNEQNRGFQRREPDRQPREFGRGNRSKRVPERESPKREERHVPRLPDGRVLKGPRPVQRKNAQFWTDVTQETESLLEPVVAATPLTEEATDQEVTVAGDEAEVSDPANSVIEPEKPKTPRTSRGRAATATARKKKTDTVTKPRSAGPKPSKPGFKWPTP